MIGAVDIGGTKIAVGMLTRAGEILTRTEFLLTQSLDCRPGWNGFLPCCVRLPRKPAGNWKASV